MKNEKDKNRFRKKKRIITQVKNRIVYWNQKFKIQLFILWKHSQEDEKENLWNKLKSFKKEIKKNKW